MSTPIILKNPSTNEQELPITSPDCVLDGNGVSVTTKLADKVDYQDIVSTTGSATNKAISQSKYTTDYNALDQRIDNLEIEVYPHIYGVEMNHSTGAYRRLNEAVGKTFARHNGSYDATIVNDFDSLYPWSKMRACKVNNNGQVTSYYGDPNYSTDTGEYMTEIPIFWYKDVVETVDGVEYRRMYIATNKVIGFRPHPIFVREDGTLKYYAYIGRMPSSYATSIHSQPDSTIKVNTSQITFRTYCASKGTNWHLYDMRYRSAIDILMHIEIGSFDEQNTIGQGVSGATAQLPVTSAIVDGLIDSSSGICGSGWIGSTNNLSNVCYRGIWDLWGNVWQWLDGWARYDGGNYFTDKPSLYPSLTANATATSLLEAGWEYSGITEYMSGNGYQKRRQVYDNGNTVFSLPKELGGASNTYYCAYLSNFASSYAGLRALLCGGAWNNGANCSLVFEYGNYAPSYTSSGIGSRLCLE